MEQSPANYPAGVRPPAVAGWFYPADPVELRRMLGGFFSQVLHDIKAAPKAIIAPHAGYLFSGTVAAMAYIRLVPARDVIKRIVLIGPAHRVSFNGLATVSAESFATPLGLVPVDTDAVREICSLPQVCILDETHAREHSIEVHLPFLQALLNDFKIVPLAVGDASDEEVAAVIDALWDGPSTRFVISSDLSHYHEYTRAKELDSFTSRAIEGLRPEDITEEHACGRVPIRGLLESARRHGLHAHTVDLRNSGDTAGSHSEVVGYGAFVFEEHGQPRQTPGPPASSAGH